MKKLTLPSNASAIICMDYLHQLLPALTALADQQSSREPTLLFLKSQLGSRLRAEDFSLLRKMLAKFPNIQIVLAEKWMCSSRIPVKLRARLLSRHFKHLSIKRLFFAHDVSADFTAQVLMQALPKAERICYGDALGLVYSHHYFEQLMYEGQNPGQFSLFHFLGKLKRRFILPRASKRYSATLAVLAIPCDPGKDFMGHCRLKIPKKELMLEIAERIKAGLPEFSNYLNKIKNESPTPLVFFATSNLTESKLSSRENEIALYHSIIQKEVKAPARILIKPHPGADKSTMQELKKVLEAQFEVLIFEEKYNALPIELSQELFENIQILSISYASISLPYLHNQAVTHAINDELIKQYIFPEKQNWFKSNNDLYLSMMVALKTWDGNSLLSAPPSSRGKASGSIFFAKMDPANKSRDDGIAKQGVGTADADSRVKIAVIIVNYNSHEYLARALHALANQTVPPFKVIVLDNNSKKAIPHSIIPTRLPVQIIQSTENLGFAGGNNYASTYAKDCEWIALLNPDAFPDEKWLEALSQAIHDFPDHAFFATKLLKADSPSLFDGSGDEYHISGRAWRRDFHKPNHQQRDVAEEVFAPCAAAALYRQDAWESAGGFDENYFCYFEDVDLAFRLRLLGYRCQYIPNAIAHHVGSAVTERHSDFYIYYGQRNMVWTYVKNMPGFLFWFYLPLHISLNIAAIILFTLKGRGKVIFKAKWDACKDIARVWKQRQHWQASRTISSKSLRKILSKGRPWQKN